MGPGAGEPCMLCRLQRRPAVLLSLSVTLFGMILVASLLALLL
jgi:hypothetical protein